VRKAQKRLDVWKAAQVLLQARSSWPWMAAQGVVSVATAVVAATAPFYHSELLETFREKRFRWARFGQVARAVATVELLKTLLRSLETQLTQRGLWAAADQIRVAFFKALLKKELSWWAARRGPWWQVGRRQAPFNHDDTALPSPHGEHLDHLLLGIPSHHQPRGWQVVNQMMGLEREIGDVLAIPQELFSRAVTIATQANLVAQHRIAQHSIYSIA
jgi:hypothetical protein